jgi:hypothetical protein
MIYNRSLQDFFTNSKRKNDQLTPFLLGRNAFVYLIQCLKIETIILPCFICPLVVDIFKNSGIKIYFYSNLDKNLETPINSIIEEISNIKITEQTFFLWHDYLNLIGDMPEKLYELLEQKKIQPIIDATHSLPGKDYKCQNVVFGFRKLLNQPFGALLKTTSKSNPPLITLPYIKSIKFLLAFKIKTNILIMFKGFENGLINYFLKKIITLTDYYSFDKNNHFINHSYHYDKIIDIHSQLDYQKIESRRNQNFLQYSINFPKNLNIKIFNTSCPFGFPLVTKNNVLLRSHLWGKGVHSFLLWRYLHEDALEYNDKDSSFLSKSTLILPVNQDLTINDINKISKIINDY